MDAQRALLAQLMGEEDPTQNDPGKGLKFTDERVCRAYLAGCCPAELFKGTKLDRGGCGRIHSPLLKERYEKVADKVDFGFDKICLDTLEASIRDCDRKIIKTAPKDSTSETKETEKIDRTEQISQAQSQIEAKLQEAEELGSAGDLTKARYAMQEVEELKEQISEWKEGTRRVWDMSRPMEMVMCEICGSILHSDEVGQDLRHYKGRIHVAFATMRDKVPELKKRVMENRNKPYQNPAHGEGGDSDSRQDRRRRSDSRDRDRERDRERRDRDRTRKRRSRSRDRERKRKSRRHSRSRS